MKGKEGIYQSGPGVTYKKTVSVRNDKVKGHADAASKYSGTKEAFNKSCNNTKETW